MRQPESTSDNMTQHNSRTDLTSLLSSLADNSSRLELLLSAARASSRRQLDIDLNHEIDTAAHSRLESRESSSRLSPAIAGRKQGGKHEQEPNLELLAPPLPKRRLIISPGKEGSNVFIRADPFLMDQLLLLVQAFQDDNLSLVDSLSQHIRAQADPEGRATQRLARHVLTSLSCRFYGPKYKEWVEKNQLIEKSVEGFEISNSVRAPYVTFLYLSLDTLLIEALSGEPHIHIIYAGGFVSPHWVGFIKKLARLPCHNPLTLEFTLLQLVKAEGEVEPADAVSRVSSDIQAEAARHGIKFSFRCLCGDPFDPATLQVGEGQTVAVAFVDELHRVCDEPAPLSGLSPRDELLQRVASIKPEVVILVDSALDSKNPSFHSRATTIIPYFFSMFRSLDAAKPAKAAMRYLDKFLGQRLEDMLVHEGLEGRFRYEDFDAWRRRFSRAGLHERAINSLVCDTVSDMLKDFPKGYEVVIEENGMCLQWEGQRALFAGTWTAANDQS